MDYKTIIEEQIAFLQKKEKIAMTALEACEIAKTIAYLAEKLKRFKV